MDVREKLTIEQWKPVNGFEGRYEVSSLGRIRSLLTGAPRLLHPGLQSRGYLTVMLYDGTIPKKPRSITVHKIVADAFIGPCQEGMTVNHIDGDKKNNEASNLEYISLLENCRHARAMGKVRLSNERDDVLNDDEKRSIRTLRQGRASITEILETVNADRAKPIPRSWVVAAINEA